MVPGVRRDDTDVEGCGGLPIALLRNAPDISVINDGDIS
jgi:hypothetical protein